MIGFGQPLGLVTLLALPAVWALLRLLGRRRALADARYGGGPGIRPQARRGLARASEALLLLALGALALAVARPTWGHADTPLVRRGIDVAIALDVSRSMSAADIAPSRALAASAGLQRLLRALPGDRAALVTFAGTAFQRSPLTLDLDALAQLIAQAQGETGLVDRGTDLALAIEGALATLDVTDRADTQVIVLVSDGEHVGRDLDPAIRHARDLGVRVYTVAAGTSEGADIPGSVPRGGPPQSRLDRETIERIARETGGGVRELAAIAGLAVEFSRLRQSAFEGTAERAPVERFPWFIGAALVALLLRSLVGGIAPGRGTVAAGQLRRSARGALAVGALLLGACGTAGWQAVDTGNREYARARFEQALAAYQQAAALAPDEPGVVYNQGNALHSLRRYDEATVASLDAAERTKDPTLRARARYALGNHAFRRNDLAAARDAYTAVLLADSADEDARHNLELVLLLQQAQDPQEDAQTSPDGDPADAGNGGQPGQPGGQGQPGQPGSPGRPGQPPGAGSSAGSSGGGTQGPGGPSAPGGPQTPADAQAALAAATAALGENVTLEEALALLDRLRQLEALERLEDRRPPGSLPDR